MKGWEQWEVMGAVGTVGGTNDEGRETNDEGVSAKYIGAFAKRPYIT